MLPPMASRALPHVSGARKHMYAPVFTHMGLTWALHGAPCSTPRRFSSGTGGPSRSTLVWVPSLSRFPVVS